MQIAYEAAIISGQIFAGWMLADFVSGVFHWMEDRYGSPRWPIIGGAIRDTIRHHSKPRGMLKKSALRRSWRVLALTMPGLLVFALLGWLNPFSVTFIMGASIANEIHVAAHCSPNANGRFITALQKTGIIQSHAHHAAHHRGLKNVNYCTVTNWLNPALERVRFWRKIEALIKVYAKQRPRPDPVVRRRQRRRWRSVLRAA